MADRQTSDRQDELSSASTDSLLRALPAAVYRGRQSAVSPARDERRINDGLFERIGRPRRFELLARRELLLPVRVRAIVINGDRTFGECHDHLLLFRSTWKRVPSAVVLEVAASTENGRSVSCANIEHGAARQQLDLSTLRRERTAYRVLATSSWTMEPSAKCTVRAARAWLSYVTATCGRVRRRKNRKAINAQRKLRRNRGRECPVPRRDVPDRLLRRVLLRRHQE